MSEAEWERTIKQVTAKPEAVDWQKRIEEAVKPVTPEYEERIKAAMVEVDEFKRVSGELKEKYGLEQKPVEDEEKRELVKLLREVADTLRYLEDVKGVGVNWPKILELAVRVEDYIRKIGGGSNPDREKEEYEEARLRALRTPGPKLLPV